MVFEVETSSKLCTIQAADQKRKNSGHIILVLGEPSKGFNFQFGSINMNGLPQFPARTSSAPPNLDEQKRNQAFLICQYYKGIYFGGIRNLIYHAGC
ncbi:unnamed protein product [Urochloa humidicola]